LDRPSITNMFTYKDIVQVLVLEIPEIREVPGQAHKCCTRMVEESWINRKSNMLDDGTHFQEIVRRKLQGTTRDPLLCGGYLIYHISILDISML
jgi:ribonuclease Z